MSPQNESPDGNSTTASERSPLLGDQKQTPDNGTIEREAGEEAQEEPSDIPLAEQPSNAKLFVTLGTLYFGVFFAALGMYNIT